MNKYRDYHWILYEYGSETCLQCLDSLLMSYFGDIWGTSTFPDTFPQSKKAEKQILKKIHKLDYNFRIICVI